MQPHLFFELGIEPPTVKQRRESSGEFGQLVPHRGSQGVARINRFWVDWGIISRRQRSAVRESLTVATTTAAAPNAC
jgi:hypothetical protein